MNDLLDDKLICAGCGDCLADPTVTTGEQCVRHRSCSCHHLASQENNDSDALKYEGLDPKNL